ncbi:MAG: hypothetical protein ABEJ30_05265 [Halorientalis sp.]
MKVRVDGQRREGPAVDLRGVDVSGRAVLAAVRDPDDDRVACPEPGPVHERVGHVHEEMGLSVRAAVAAAARTRGATAPQDEAIEEARAARDAVDVPAVDLEAARERVAEAGAAEDELRERVARLSGQLEARREVGASTEDVEAALAEATRRLSEAETERIAARQALRRAREAARDARDARERRLELGDRVANLRRAARTHLAAACWDQFREALAAVPGDADAGPDPGDVDGSTVTAALAVVRLADLSAPVVLACERFPSAEAARDCLAAPVIRV